MSPTDDGYPTKEELSRVLKWNEADPAGWLRYIASIWHFNERGVTVNGAKYHLSTGGWSGNEEIIETMQKSWLWWRTWESTRRGGHYLFRMDR